MEFPVNTVADQRCLQALRPAARAFLVDAMASRWRWWSRFHLQVRGDAPSLPIIDRHPSASYELTQATPRSATEDPSIHTGST